MSLAKISTTRHLSTQIDDLERQIEEQNAKREKPVLESLKLLKTINSVTVELIRICHQQLTAEETGAYFRRLTEQAAIVHKWLATNEH